MSAIKHYRRHRFIWAILTVIMKPYLTRRFNYKFKVCSAHSPLLVISNHVTDWDPFFIGLCFPQHLYFVASDHIFRWGFVSKLINWVVAPIPHLKSARGISSTREILRRLRGGANVCLFAEGNRTWDGVTGDFLPSAGKLARISGATLVTFRISGGYFTQPRWSKALRKGKAEGKAVGIYPPEQLKKMSPEQINAIIAKDIFEDAYARQRSENIAFKGKNPAENLETLLCACPECDSLGHMHSNGDRFSCTFCGFTVRYGENGFFSGDDLPFDNVADWNAWQNEKLLALAGDESKFELLSDEGIELTQILSINKRKSLGSGRMSLNRDMLRVCDMEFPLDKLTGISMIGRAKLNFTCSGLSYELSSRKSSCFKKYLLVLSRLAADNKLEQLLIT